MPLFLIIVGIALLVTAYQGTYADLGTQLEKDFSGSQNFLIWIAAIGVIGVLGYIKAFETPSRWMLALIILVLFISNNGFFSQFSSQIQTGSGSAGGTIHTEPNAPGPATIQILGLGTTGGGLLGALGVGKSGGAATGGGTTATGGLF